MENTKPFVGEASDGRPSSATTNVWALIDSKNPAVLIQHLRAAGCPEKTVQDILFLRLARVAQSRVLAMAASVDASTPYWKNAYRQELELNYETTLIRDEMLAQLDQLFGEAAPAVRLRLMGMPENYAAEAYLPAEKSAALRRLIREASRVESAVRSSQTEMPYGWVSEYDEEDRRLRAKKQNEAIRSLLTSSEYEEYLVRESPSAQFIRRQYPQSSSEREFRRMVLLANEMGLGEAPPDFSTDSSLRSDGADDPMKAWHELASNFRKKLASDFGEDRIGALQEEEKRRLEDDQKVRAHEELLGIGKEAGLSSDEIESFYGSMKSIEAEMDARFSSALRKAGSAAELEIIKAEQQSEIEIWVTDLLGADKGQRLLEALRRQGQ